MTNNVLTILSGLSDWTAPEVDNATMMHGDMPGDKIEIGDSHKQKAAAVFPVLVAKLKAVMENHPHQRAVVCVCGGSGVGKSEIASLLGEYLQQAGVGSYVLSGDNYPHRIPAQNDAERLRVFRCGGVRGLVAGGVYNEEVKATLRTLQEQDVDASPALCAEHPWLAVYQKEGKKALNGYLGTDREQNFEELSAIISQFKNGAKEIYLKRMGRTPLDLWYDLVDFSEKNVLLIEWTHGNSNGFSGVDIPVLLNSTPQETLEHRRSRNRDGAVDSPFTTMVLELEQRQLESQAHKAEIIVAKSGELLSYAQYRQLMANA